MKAELIPADGGRPIPITKDVTVLGRREYCDIQIDDPSLSKRHCVLVKTDGLLVIRNLATTNGTKVKGQKIRWAALLPEDRIAFGGVKFKVYLGPDDVPSPSEGGAEGRRPRPGRPTASPRRRRSQSLRNRNRNRSLAPSMTMTTFPLILNEGAWRDALGSDSGDDEEIIELD